MKKVLFTFVLIAIVFLAKSQQLPLYSQYMMNGFLLNPGITGSVEGVPIRLTVRQQWVGLEDAPATQAISAHLLLPNKQFGVGGYIFNDKFGPISSTGIQASAAYHIPLDENTKIGLGLSLSAFQFSLDEGNLTAIDDGDVVLTGAVESTFVPDANFGAYLYSDKYFVGLSGAQLVQYKIKLHEQLAGNNQMIRHYYATAGYTFKLGEEFDLQPSLLAKGTEKTPIQVDINAKALYKKHYWLGVSYRSSQSVITILGLKYDRFYFGYAFDYTFSNLKNYNNGSHEIMLGFDIGGSKTGSSLL